MSLSKHQATEDSTMSDNSIEVIAVFNEDRELLKVFTNKYDAMEFLVENSDEDSILYTTTGTIELPTIEE